MLEDKKKVVGDGLPNYKTDFRVKNTVLADNDDFAGQPTPMGQVEFAYAGTDKGVNK